MEPRGLRFHFSLQPCRSSRLYDVKVTPSSGGYQFTREGLGECPGLSRHSIKLYHHLLIILHYIFLPTRKPLGTSGFQGTCTERTRGQKEPHPGHGACLPLPSRVSSFLRNQSHTSGQQLQSSHQHGSQSMTQQSFVNSQRRRWHSLRPASEIDLMDRQLNVG